MPPCISFEFRCCPLHACAAFAGLLNLMHVHGCFVVRTCRCEALVQMHEYRPSVGGDMGSEMMICLVDSEGWGLGVDYFGFIL